MKICLIISQNNVYLHLKETDGTCLNIAALSMMMSTPMNQGTSLSIGFHIVATPIADDITPRNPCTP